MPYVWSLVLFVAGVLLLLVLLVRFFTLLRRVKKVQREVANDVSNRSGLLKARIAGLQVALAERRNGAA
ncbi:bacteriophage holin [Saccharopolyspora sp. NFXS83]|uniref:bacteriophage holin n=1 Tax=Saccharopolyspora sp. NFXS83 TaxID=2993560 RepID=UPI00224AC92D|nr:bacteriophage holin [Saccharopolyspora sp. NFXS83]MCX2732795.1 bacteriophage holin [Saccharopolyspora sp. NFXS83]